MARSNKWVAFVAKLNEQTQEGKMRWRADRFGDDLLVSHFQRYGPVYSVEVGGATVRIYHERLRQMTLDEEEFWEDSVVMDIKTTTEGEFVRIPMVPGIEDLYETVAYKSNKVDEFLDRFLSEK